MNFTNSLISMTPEPSESTSSKILMIWDSLQLNPRALRREVSSSRSILPEWSESNISKACLKTSTCYGVSCFSLRLYLLRGGASLLTAWSLPKRFWDVKLSNLEEILLSCCSSNFRLFSIRYYQMKEEADSSVKFEIAKVQPKITEEAVQKKEEMKLDLNFILLALLTKTLPIIFFFALSSYSIVDFTVVLICSSIDFWTIKNITGRKLVGMTWWMKINEKTGEEEWIFHSSEATTKLNPLNEQIFWGCLLLGAVFWGVTSVLSLIVSRLFWIALCATCFILGLINFRLFIKCRGQHQEKFKDLVDKMGIASARHLVEDF